MPRSTERSTGGGSPDHFAQIPLSLLTDERPEVTAYVRLVYAAIHSYCTFGTTTGAYPTTIQLAKRMGCSERQVKYAREALRAMGYVSWKTGSKRYNQGNLYTLHPAGDGFKSAPPAPNGVASKVKSPPPALRPGHHLHSDQGTTCPPQRAMDREPVTENYRKKSAHGCSHPDTACCKRCV
jgi:helix-turn-helix protein